jgi:hypothetical protein
MAKNAANAIVANFMLASFKNGRGRLNRRSLGWFLISARASMMRDELASVSRCRHIRMQGMPSVQYADPARRRWTRSETRRALTAHATAPRTAGMRVGRGLYRIPPVACATLFQSCLSRNQPSRLPVGRFETEWKMPCLGASCLTSWRLPGHIQRGPSSRALSPPVSPATARACGVIIMSAGQG